MKQKQTNKLLFTSLLENHVINSTTTVVSGLTGKQKYIYTHTHIHAHLTNTSIQPLCGY